MGSTVLRKIAPNKSYTAFFSSKTNLLDKTYPGIIYPKENKVVDEARTKYYIITYRFTMLESGREGKQSSPELEQPIHNLEEPGTEA